MADEHAANEAKAKALFALGVVIFFQGNWVRSAAVLKESLALYRILNSKKGVALALCMSSVLERWINRDNEDLFSSATALSENAIEMARETGDAWTLAFTLMWSYGTRQARFIEHRNPRIAELKEAEDISRELGDTFGVAFSLNGLGDVYRFQRRYNEARACYAEAIELFKSLGERVMTAQVMRNIARLSFIVGDLALVAQARGDNRRAARLLGACEKNRKSVTYLRETRVVYHVEVEDELPRYEKEFPVEWREGQRMSFDRAVEYALEDSWEPVGPMSES